jgi:hypothetical protein
VDASKLTRKEASEIIAKIKAATREGDIPPSDKGQRGRA